MSMSPVSWKIDKYVYTMYFPSAEVLFYEKKKETKNDFGNTKKQTNLQYKTVPPVCFWTYWFA